MDGTCRVRHQGHEKRLTTVGEQVSLLRSDEVHIQHRLDRVEDRLGRIENCLDLIHA